jgi:hypothetical protein
VTLFWHVRKQQQAQVVHYLACTRLLCVVEVTVDGVREG